MAIIYDKERHTYYITYRLQLANGETRQRKIRNKERTKKNVVKNIEVEEIEKDKELFLKTVQLTASPTYSKFVDNFFDNFSLTHKQQTTYGFELILSKYITPFVENKKKISEVFEPKTIVYLQSKIKEIIAKEKTTFIPYNKTMLLLNHMLEYGVDTEVVNYEAYNRCKRLLKKAKLEKKATREIISACWTPEEFDLFIKTFEEIDQKRKMFFEIAYWGALRIGEILALTWADIDFAKSTISINKAMSKQSTITSVKNDSSNGIIDLPNKVMSELKEFKEAYNNPKDTDFVFFITPTSRTTIRRIMDKHIELANLKHIKFHGLRHSMASRMINAGLNPLYVSKHLRHSSTQQTLDTYSHLFPKITKDLINSI